jgi:hypothetical protein
MLVGLSFLGLSACAAGYPQVRADNYRKAIGSYYYRIFPQSDRGFSPQSDRGFPRKVTVDNF